ncbi:alanine--glyoxylate aminotransferase family protein [Nostoc sp. NIES-2111]
MMPGPTPVPEAVLLALAKHPIGHRTKEFSEILGEVTANLKWLHQTENDVLMLNVSGTGAVEAGIINFLCAGDRILVGANGKFGERWVEVSQAYGLNVETIAAEWGKPLDPSLFAEKLQADTQKQIKAVVITHSETSTGVLNDLATINRHVKAHGTALIIVDAITSLGVVNVPVDAWGLDVVVSSSQKAYMTPPGIGFVCASPKAWDAYQTANLPKYYLDLGKYRQAAVKDTTPFSPPVNLIVALQVALRMLKKEGLESIFARHERLKNATRAAINGLNLSLLVEDSFASPALTAVVPQKIEADTIRSFLKKRFDLELAGGQDQLKNKIFRIGHLGFVSDRDILICIASLEVALTELGYTDFIPGAGVAAATQVFKT